MTIGGAFLHQRVPLLALSNANPNAIFLLRHSRIGSM
jgi:hypothetical protein